MKRTKEKKRGAVASAAAKVAGAGRPKVGPEKKVVTLYLEAELYDRIQQRHGRGVSSVINDLIRAYLQEDLQKSDA